jgi:tetratricopeptide (TPR) repeat protein
LKKAFALKDRATEPERFYIQAHYYDQVTGQLDETIETYEDWRRTYPRDSIPLDNLGLAYLATGEFEKTLALGKQALQVDPTDAYAREHIVYSYLCLNRFDEAHAVAEETIAKKLDTRPVHTFLFGIAFLKRDRAGMDRELTWSKGTEHEPFMLGIKAGTEMSLGKVQLAQASFRDAEASAQRNGMKEFAAVLKAVAARRQAAYGDCGGARAATAASLAEVPDGENRKIAALALAECGDAAAAKKLMDEEAKEYPQNSVVHGIYMPLVEALSGLQRNDGSSTIAALEPARRFDLAGQPPNAPYWILYVRGRGYLQSKQPDKAAAEFQRILDFRGRQADSELIPLAQLQLARALVSKGDTGKARTAYQDFLAMWKDADPDIPVLKQAKSEYAKLE